MIENHKICPVKIAIAAPMWKKKKTWNNMQLAVELTNFILHLGVHVHVAILYYKVISVIL